MTVKEIKKDIYWVGAIDWDRRLFDELIPLPEGTREAKIVTNEKCKNMLMEHLLIKEDRIITVNDNDTLSLGGKTLRFIFTPWVHWPETMLTYLEEDKVLFSCDLFGAHLAESNLWVDDEYKVYFAAKRYYAEIMMPFRSNIKKHLEKLKELEIKTIAPSHGQIYSHPEFILSAYREWISDEVENEVIILYVSMHGSVEEMVYILT
ncbi:MBL fold hydrolase, partial [Candidatus Atribacteria bacterium HGW-Atribacteria-1]